MGDSPKWVKSKKRRKKNTGTAGGPGGRDRTLAVKSRKTGSIWQIGPGSMWQIGPGSMWQIGPGSMWQIKGKDGEKKEKKLNDGNNNGQATHGARKHAWRMQAAWANKVQGNNFKTTFLSISKCNDK